MKDGNSFIPENGFYYSPDISYIILHQLPYKDVLNEVRYVSSDIVGYKLMSDIPGNQELLKY